MNKKRSFTLIEILIGLCILSALATFSVLAARYYFEKSKSAEAIITAGHISKAEEAKKLENGSYIAAESTQEINERLGMGIVSKDYEYRVVGVTDENFIVLAQRIGLDIQEGQMPEPPVLLAMDRSGVIPGGYQSYPGGASAGGGQIGGGIGGGSDSGGGSGGGGGGGGGSGGGGSGGGGDGSNRGGSHYSIRPDPVYDSDLDGALALLESSATGKYYYDLIMDEEISYEFGALSSGKLGQWDGYKITINQDLKTTYPESAIAAVIAHEATHVDYELNPEKWVALTLAAHPKLTPSDLHIYVYPYNSLDQEYHCFENSVLVWREARQEGDICRNMSGEDDLYSQGEENYKINIWDRYADIPVTEGGLIYEF